MPTLLATLMISCGAPPSGYECGPGTAPRDGVCTIVDAGPSGGPDAGPGLDGDIPDADNPDAGERDDLPFYEGVREVRLSSSGRSFSLPEQDGAVYLKVGTVARFRLRSERLGLLPEAHFEIDGESGLVSTLRHEGSIYIFPLAVGTMALRGVVDSELGPVEHKLFIEIDEPEAEITLEGRGRQHDRIERLDESFAAGFPTTATDQEPLVVDVARQVRVFGKVDWQHTWTRDDGSTFEGDYHGQPPTEMLTFEVASGPASVDDTGIVTSTGTAGLAIVAVTYSSPAPDVEPLRAEVTIDFVEEQPIQALMTVATIELQEELEADYRVSSFSTMSTDHVGDDTTLLHSAREALPRWNLHRPVILEEDGDSLRIDLVRLRGASLDPDANPQGSTYRDVIAPDEVAPRVYGDADSISIDGDRVTRQGPGFALLAVGVDGLEAPIVVWSPPPAEQIPEISVDPQSTTLAVDDIDFRDELCQRAALSIAGASVEPPYELAFRRQFVHEDGFFVNSPGWDVEFNLSENSGSDPREICITQELQWVGDFDVEKVFANYFYLGGSGNEPDAQVEISVEGPMRDMR
jgi:hypothetical protein